MKRLHTLLYLFIIFLSTTSVLAQGEARNWYFGNNAGIKFLPDGTVVPLNNGKIVTNEGCSSMSDADGNLLFYTDGRTVWDKNHKIMPNGNYTAGTGLLGDPSSTQSGIIVPKKGDPNIYYIFTVDEPHQSNAQAHPNQFTGTYPDQGGTVPSADDGFNNGFNYSVVDLSVTGSNGSIGDVVTRNEHLLTYNPLILDQAKYKCSEKITAVKTADGSGFWVITHFIDSFYAFKVNASGVNTTPVVSTVSPNVPVSGYRRNAIGYLKASPDGRKLAIAHQQRGTTTGGATANGVVMIYDFNAITGEVSNGQQVKNNINPYGIEFSPEANKLYVSYDVNGGSSGIRQYNLLAPVISTSEVFITGTGSTGALQLGPNQKIYYTSAGAQFLSVINSPELDGTLCDFQVLGAEIGGPANKMTTLGLPPFITSLFSANIVAENTCLGNATQLRLSVNTSFDTVKWNFGDGSPETTALTVPEVTHTFPATGTYNITATVVKNGDANIITSEIIISATPVANTSAGLVACDTDNDGFQQFDLIQATPSILGTQSTTTFDVKYFTTQENADNDTNAVAATAFTNTTNPQTIYARVFNKNNTQCYATTSFQITVSASPALNSHEYALCDDGTDGSDSNGQTTFTLNAVTQALVQNAPQFTVTYYTDINDATAVTNALGATFYNTTPAQQLVFARVVNTANPQCFSIEPIILVVNSLPVPPLASGASLTQCDIGVTPDGRTQFLLSDADNQFTNGDVNLTVSYYLTQADAQANTSPLANIYTNIANPQQVFARVSNVQTGCFRVLPLTLNVNTNAVAPIVLQNCDDDGVEDGLRTFNLTDAGLENGTDTVLYYANATDALLKQNAVTAAFTTTIPNQQSVYARVESNSQCTAIYEIKLIVRALPNIDTTGEGVVCLNTRDYITLTPGLNNSNNFYAFVWSTGATTRNIAVNQPGTYTVRVIDTRFPTLCEKTRTITVTASDVAVITDVEIHDLTENNTVTVHVRPGNNVNTTYQYSLNLPTGPYQDSNIFENVEAGIHTVYVYDTQGCGVVSKDIAVLGIPKFFTPNQDGVNDTWNIIGVNALFYRNSKIYIFDRFGKLLANVDPRGAGWTGIYNGHALPATDYWYVLELDNGRIVKGHFSLMR